MTINMAPQCLAHGVNLPKHQVSISIEKRTR